MKVVVVGAGMVGHRFADELRRLDPWADVTLLGEENYEPYNRVLLTELLAGRVDLAGLTLATLDDDVEMLLGQPALEIDRARKAVVTADGLIEYDHLVLATGAKARVIPVPGLRDGLPRGAHVLRDLDDARDVKAAALNARHAVIIGGGPLGLEAAAALRHRGVGVTVLSIMDTLLDTVLDPNISEVVEATSADLGIEFLGGIQIESVDVKDGQVESVHVVLAGSETRVIDAQIVVLAAGAVPNTHLAAEAGLETAQGIVVGHDFRTTSDPSISAIGDCAQTPVGTSGLVAPGWAQARELAKSLVHGTLIEPVPITGSTLKLKAVGMDVLTMGRRASTADSHDRVVNLHDAAGRRHVEVVVRDDTLVGATCVGAPDIAAHLSTQFDRPGMIPADPLQLLLGSAGGSVSEAPSPTTMPKSTTVCRCNGVSKGDLVREWENGCTTVEALAEKTLATTGCGGCKSLVCGIVDWLTEVDPPVRSEAEEVEFRPAGRSIETPAR
jgi:assimilatory nitrate reductase electron transfer subunit